MGVELRSAFYVFENGEVANIKIVSSYDSVKAAGAYKKPRLNGLGFCLVLITLKGA